jgi:hypothetical protein
MISEVFREKCNFSAFFPLCHYMHTITSNGKISSTKKRQKYSLGAEGSSFSLRDKYLKDPLEWYFARCC